MKQRLLDINRDCDILVAMQRESWRINFPDEMFNEAVFLASLRSGAKRDEIYVYELEGELVGWLWLEKRLLRVAHVRHIQVERSHWAKGIGRQIMEDAISMSTAAGQLKLTLNVTKSNARALALYTRLGFVVTKDRGDRQCMELCLDRI